jgi:hypothetical protein
VFIERLWKTIKNEHVYLHAYATVSEAKAKLAVYVELTRFVPGAKWIDDSDIDLYFHHVCNGRDRQGKVISAVGIAGLRERVEPNIDAFAESVSAAARELSRWSGASVADSWEKA